MPSYTKRAGGSIKPMRFVALDTSNPGRVTQAGAGAQIYGVSGVGKRYAPYASLDDGYHAVAGENAIVHGPPEKDVSLVLGGTVTTGQFIKSDANGEGVASTADQEDVGAIAMADGVAGDAIPVQLIVMERSTT